MATRIRLRRTGKKKQAYYRVVVADSRSPRDGRFIEILGNYNPNSNPPRIEIDEGRTLYWLKNGARPTDTVRSLLSKEGILARLAEEMPGHAVLKRPQKKSKAVMESRKPAVEEVVEEEVAAEVPEEVAGDVAEEAVEEMAAEVPEDAAGIVAEEAAEEVVEEVAGDVTEEAAEEVVEEVAGDVAEEAVEEVVEEVAETEVEEVGEAAEEDPEETTEEASASEKVDDEPGDETEA